MMSVKFKAVLPAARISEGPFWQEDINALLYVDIANGKLRRYFPQSGRQQELTVEKCSTGDTVSFVLPVRGRPDLLIIGHGRDVAGIKWGEDAPDSSTGRSVSLASVEQGKETRFNDAKCDPEGRIWAGTMGLESTPGVVEPSLSALYMINSMMEPTVAVDKISLSNGLAWSIDKKTMYYIDSCNYKVEAFDYESSTGSLSNRRTISDYKKEGLDIDIPDGMNIDTDGNLWVANYFGKKLLCIDPIKGEIIRTVPTPTTCPTSVCFGGPDYSIMYVTSGQIGLTDEQLNSEASNGALMEVTGLGVKGYPSITAVVDPSIVKKIDI